MLARNDVLGMVMSLRSGDEFVLPQTDTRLGCICGELLRIEPHVTNDIANETF